MKINTESLVSMTEANQNFSKIARQVDEQGLVIIMKNNRPRYIVADVSLYYDEQLTCDEDVAEISQRLIEKNRSAYAELAK